MNQTARNLIPGIALLLIAGSLVTAVTLTAPQFVRANPGVLYAAPTAQGSGDCSSWDNACTLPTALATAVSGDEIWAKMGVHYPGAAGNRAATFTLKNGVVLYGGFAGTETLRNERDPQANPTILSGDIDGNDLTDPNGVVTTTANIVGSNAYHVVTGGGTDSTAVLDGFTVTAGKADGSDSQARGGGMYNSSSSPMLTNVTFSGNAANWDGGGMYNNYSNPTLTDVTFSGNSADSYGGGMYNHRGSPTLTNVTFSGNSTSEGGGMYNDDYSSPTLTNVTFSGNSAQGDGGGMYNYYSNPTLTDVTFSGNSAAYDGGGMRNLQSSPTLTDVTFSGNSAQRDGGGMYNTSSSPTLTNVTFSGNSVQRDGGGIYNYYYSNPTLTNVIFSGNTAAYHGGGMRNLQSSPTLTDVTFSGNSASSGGGVYNYYYSTPTLTNVTFSGNSASFGGGVYNYYYTTPTLTNVTFSGNSANDSGGGMYNDDHSSPTLTNVILWGDSAPTGPEIYNNSSTPIISYSDIQGCGGSGGWNSACGTDGGGNIATDPRFVNAAGGNLRLQLTSPAIDAGNNATVPGSITTDMDGNPRFVDILTVPDTGNGTPPIVDMGAYETQQYLVFLPLVLRNTP